VRHHAIPGALLLALALATGGGGGSLASAPTPKPTPSLVIQDPAVPPAPTQASGSYNHDRDLAAGIRLVPPPRRRNTVGLVAALSGVAGPSRGLDLAELSIYSFIP